jgi:hypothetical protein
MLPAALRWQLEMFRFAQHDKNRPARFNASMASTGFEHSLFKARKKRKKSIDVLLAF